MALSLLDHVFLHLMCVCVLVRERKKEDVCLSSSLNTDFSNLFFHLVSVYRYNFKLWDQPIPFYFSFLPTNATTKQALHNVMIRIALTSQHSQETFICKVHISLYICTIDFTDQNEQVSALCWSSVWLLYAFNYVWTLNDKIILLT